MLLWHLSHVHVLPVVFCSYWLESASFSVWWISWYIAARYSDRLSNWLRSLSFWQIVALTLTRLHIGWWAGALKSETKAANSMKQIRISGWFLVYVLFFPISCDRSSSCWWTIALLIARFGVQVCIFAASAYANLINSVVPIVIERLYVCCTAHAALSIEEKR